MQLTTVTVVSVVTMFAFAMRWRKRYDVTTTRLVIRFVLKHGLLVEDGLAGGGRLEALTRVCLKVEDGL